MSATMIERRSRAEFLALTGRREFAPRPLTADQRDKVARAVAIKAKRDGLRRVQDAAARIQFDLEQRLEQARRSGGADEGWLLREVRLLRCDLDDLEI